MFLVILGAVAAIGFFVWFGIHLLRDSTESFVIYHVQYRYAEVGDPMEAGDEAEPFGSEAAA